MNKLGLGVLALASVALSSHAANADVAGRYENIEKDAMLDLEMTIEVNDADDVRIQMARTGSYYLLKDDTLYIVSINAKDITVMKMADTLEIRKEAMARFGMKLPPQSALPTKFRFAPMEEVTVSGRKGTAYGMISEENEKPVYGSIVVGNDPALAKLGKAIARANASSIQGMGSMGTMLQTMNTDMMALLERGAPLRMLSIELTDVSFDTIPSERFSLPAEPLTIDEIRALAIKPTVPHPPTLPSRGE